MATTKEREILRQLATRVAEIAAHPEMDKKKKILTDFNSLKAERPLVLCFPEGSWGEIVREDELVCEDKELRLWERILRQRIFWWDHIRDDNVFEPWLQLEWKVHYGDYGFPVNIKYGKEWGNSYTWIPPITNLAEQVHQMHIRDVQVDREGTYKTLDRLNSIFGDILPTKIVCMKNSFSMIKEAMFLVGLDELMYLMYDEPEAVHKMMEIMRDDQINILKYFEREGLLTSNCRDEYIGSGGVAYTTELPLKAEGEKYTLMDRWGFTEAQETVGISPDMFREFIFPYQKAVLELTGLNHYGCCEPIHDRLDDLLTIPRMRRFSVSPWCDVDICADKLKNNYIISRKPNPSPLCVGFDEKELRKEISTTLNKTKGCVVEFVMKDTHTVENDPTRMGRWVNLAYDEINKFTG
ncbi:MAG: hypothetical protein IJF54_03055 [Clostridia bacterium]|nr:hypothetical protein [Clostridia bacterium]